MTTLHLILEGDGCWPDLPTPDNPEAVQRKVIHLGNDARPIQVAVLDQGMASGRPSVTIRIDLPDGRIVLAETSARLFCMAAKAIVAKYSNLYEEQ